MSTNRITFENSNGKVVVTEDADVVFVTVGAYRAEFDTLNGSVTVYQEVERGRWEPRGGTGLPPGRPRKTMTPHCTACGNYLLPCTATANGVHPEIVGAG